MKLKNKFFIILLFIICLFILSGNKSFASYDVSIDDTIYILPDFTSDMLQYDYIFIRNTYNTNNLFGFEAFCSDSPFYLTSYNSDYRFSCDSDIHCFRYGTSYNNSFHENWGFYHDYVSQNSLFIASSTSLVYSNYDLEDELGEVVFREASGGAGGGEWFELQNPYGNYVYDGNTNNSGNTINDNFEDTTDTGWLSGFINWLLTPFRYFAQILGNIWDYITGFLGRLLAGLFDFIKTVFVPNPDDIKFDEVKEVLLNKFPIIDSFSQILTGFNNAFNEESGQPNFVITLPAFLGGATVNAIDFRFYNQYRSWIHGFIIASCYFLYIRRVYHKIPKIVKGE